MAKGAAGAFLPSRHLSPPAQCPSLPPPLPICPFEHFQICRPCMPWPRAPSPASSPRLCLLLATLAFYSFSEQPNAFPPQSLCKHAICCFVFCLAESPLLTSTHPLDFQCPGSFLDRITVCNYIGDYLLTVQLLH